MGNKISIIVPVYNVEKYVAKCLDSLVIQDYENYDVLVINDGSPYNEQAIIDDYVLRYPNIIKSIVKENGGYGSVLELAFNKSDADYVLICDPDDYLAKNTLSTLMAYQNKTDADLVVSAKNLVYEDSNEEVYDASFNTDFGVLIDGAIYRRNTKDFNMLYFLEPSPHGKLYRRDIVKNIKFPHKVSYTDNLLYFYTLNNVKSVTYSSKALSYYLINRSGNTRTDLKPGVIDSWVKVFCSILDQVENGDDIFYYRMFEAFYSVYYKVDYIKGDKEVKKEKYELLYSFLERLIPYRDNILKFEDLYGDNSTVIKRQRENLLNIDVSKKTYIKLYNTRLNGSFKSNLKNFVLNNDLLSRIYDVYHFHAKYYKTRNDEKIIVSNNVSCMPLYKDDKVHFFGYYDKPCFAYGKCLSHRLNRDNFDYGQDIDILVDDKKVSCSKAWNFQQGAMSSWFDENRIIHNDFVDGRYVSKIVDINTKEVKIIDFPIYSLSKDRKFALSLNFSRLAKLRKDYGYFNLPYDRLPDNKDDGIYYVDLVNNKYELWLSLDEIIKFKTRDNMSSAVSKVNHIDISPNSDRAIFLHRWFVDGKKYTRLLCVDIKTKELSLLADNDMVSHMCWYDNDTVFGYLRGNNNIDAYFFIGMDGKQKQLKNDLLVDDGHPSVYNSRYIVTDTYPDYTCKSKLILIDLKNNNASVIARFYSPKKYQDDRRCDLHPRFDRDTKCLTIDSVANNRRNIYHLDLRNLID